MYDFTMLAEEQRGFAKSFAKYIKDFYAPNLVLDVGCGNGVFVEELNNAGVRSLGVDNDNRVDGLPNLYLHDLTTNKPLPKSDMVLCFEVGNYMPAEYSDHLASLISSALPNGGVLFWSSSFKNAYPSFQGYAYWDDLFRKYNMVPSQEDKFQTIFSGAEKDKLKYTDYMRIYRKQAGPEGKLHNKRLHLLGLAHLPTNKNEAIACAYSQKVIKMGKMLKSLGHTVFFYGVEGSTVECDEFIPVSTKDVLIDTYGEYDYKNMQYKHNPLDNAHKVFNANAIKEIQKRKEPNDMLLICMGNYQKPISDAVGLRFIIESGIGYTGVYSEFKVFESYIWMHYIYGLLNQQCGHYYDAVIPNYFDPLDWEYSEQKDDYFLYMGRLITLKGMAILKAIADNMDCKILVAGQKSDEKIDISSPNIEIVGFADHEKRKQLMSKAKALIAPTIYVEPFGGVVIEAAMSGTPVVTTDWGAFAENVLHGKTGYKCRTLDQFSWALGNIGNISPKSCYDWAMNNFTIDRIKYMYEEYFNMVLNINTKSGWYYIDNQRESMDWLSKKYPPEV